MPTLDFKGKSFIYTHHLSVPYLGLLVVPEKSSPASRQKPDLNDNLIIHGDVSFTKDISWRKRRWLNHLGSEYLITTSPEQDDQTTNDPESAQRDWKHIAVIPVSDSLPH